jgi:hypothetical protein
MRRRLLAALVLAGCLSGCVSMPDDGAVQAVPDAGSTAGDDQFQYNPLPPQPGESPLDTVDRWLEAMTATPVSTVVARQFLTRTEGAAWNPDRAILTYDTASRTEGFSRVTVKLFGVRRLDARGQWLGAPGSDELKLTIPLEPEHGQWRISHAPDALIVDEAWFEASYQAVNLYFFDKGGRALVPEPVFLPRGDQLPTSLVRGLLQGPVQPGAERSFLPSGTSLDLAVTVTGDGVAQVPLRGDLSTLPAETLDLMAAQLAWTLRQDPEITSIQLLADGEPVVLPGGASQIPVDYGASYDPAGVYAANELYGLRQGRVVRVADGQEQALTGPFGVRAYGLSDISVSLDASLAAGVSQRRTSVVVANVYGSSGGRYATPQTVVSDATDLLHPAWDSAGRLWVVDRRRGGAVVSVFRDGHQRAVDVPGVTGRDVTDFLVSRDGTRLVAAIRLRGSDEIVISRLVAEDRLHGTPARAIVTGTGGILRIRDIGWRTPTSIFFVNSIAGAQSELRSASVDGSPATFDPDAVYSLQGDLETPVVSSPRPREPTYLRTSGGAYTPLVPNSPQLPGGLGVLHYVG